MKLVMLLCFVIISALVTVAVCPGLRRTCRQALIEAELLPKAAAAQEAEPEEGDLPAPGEVTLKGVWQGAKERAAQAVGIDHEPRAPQARALQQPGGSHDGA